MKKLGLYIHIPFCLQKCSYCDFYSLGCLSKGEEYVSALCRHIKDEAPSYKDYEIDTVFIGGGTPSVLTVKKLKTLFNTIKSSFNICLDAEFSIEANPGTLDREKLLCLKENGVNRLSLGVQSTNDSELKALGRIHTYKEFLESYHLAREVGFDNINLDIMYGLPDQNFESLSKTLDDVCKIQPEHISAYCLKIEENTPFYKKKDTLNLPSDDLEYEMYMHICSELEKHGYLQYEISNFSKEGKRCKHNIRYWLSEEYVGFGPSAHSFFNGKRYYYERNIDDYMTEVKNGKPIRAYEEEDNILNGSKEEFLMLSLRLSDGVDLEKFKSKFGVDLLESFPKIRHFIGDFMTLDDKRLHFTKKGFFVSNYILTEILLD